MDFHAFFQLGTFFFSWMFGAIAVPLSVILILLWGHYWFFLALVGYYSYRMIVPRCSWPWIQRKQANIQENHKYFNTQFTTFVDGAAPPPDSKSLLCFHPHGILCCGWALNGNMNMALLSSNCNWLGTDALFHLPLVSDMLTWYNSGPASKENMHRLMVQGKNLALLPGGFEEATFYKRGEHQVYINHRKGFVKYALQHGYSLYPVYTFGEERTFWSVSWLMRKLKFLNKYKLPAVIFCGRWCSLMPDNRVDMVTVVGKKLELPHIPQPSDGDVSTHHARYVEALKHTFETHKAQYAYDPLSQLIVR